ncbi:unnamed protein product [Polarella glacialis]|uniref:Uncharacterized protein n=1 Tax=Polarella glacialis TaxID=89957 RepID=A0A813ENK7_POLGL|nr:unnamed protein product [Polarella glacialis]
MGSRACIWGRSGNDCFEVGEKPKEMAAASATPWGTRVLAAGCFHRQSMMPRQLAAWVVFLACCFCPVAEAALNLEQVIELAMLQLRERTFVADALLHRPSVSCDSAVDGPHCEHAGLAATRYELPGQSAPSGLSLVADGLFSDRLFSSSAGGELLDEFFLGAGLKEHRLLTASEAAARPAESRRRGGRARSALLTFRGLEPRDSLPLDFAGTRRFGGGIPFRVRWEGPWQLVESPVVDNHVVRPGRFAVELRGSVGRLRFGRPVHVQSVDVSRPARVDCLPAEPPERPPPPLVIRGRKGGKVVFNEAIPSWEMLAFVNGVAFNAFTSTEMVDELVFLLGECALVGSVQVSFGDDEDEQEPAVKQQTQPRHHTKPKKQPLILAMRYGWKGYGWEEVEFRMPSSIANAPVWNLNEISQQRLTLKPGIFDAVPRNPGDAPLPGLRDPMDSEDSAGTTTTTTTTTTITPTTSSASPGKANTGAAELHTTGAGGEGLPLAVDGEALQVQQQQQQQQEQQEQQEQQRQDTTWAAGQEPPLAGLDLSEDQEHQTLSQDLSTTTTITTMTTTTTTIITTTTTKTTTTTTTTIITTTTTTTRTDDLGPETIAMPPGLEEVLDAGTVVCFDNVFCFFKKTKQI